MKVGGISGDRLLPSVYLESNMKRRHNIIISALYCTLRVGVGHHKKMMFRRIIDNYDTVLTYFSSFPYPHLLRALAFFIRT